MRLPIKYLLPAVSLFCIPGASYGDASEFSSYDECILESLKGVSSDVAANAIIASCRSTFPEAAAPAPAPAESPAEPESAQPEVPQAEAKPEPASGGESRELTQEELVNLKSTLLGFLTNYRVTFENFNDDITITEVTISVWDDYDPRGLKKYTQTMHLPPSESVKVVYDVVYRGDDEGWRWKVDSAKGVPMLAPQADNPY